MKVAAYEGTRPSLHAGARAMHTSRDCSASARCFVVIGVRIMAATTKGTVTAYTLLIGGGLTVAERADLGQAVLEV